MECDDSSPSPSLAFLPRGQVCYYVYRSFLERLYFIQYYLLCADGALKKTLLCVTPVLMSLLV